MNSNISTPLYCIPGWGFNANVFKYAEFYKSTCFRLNYFNAANISINSISKYLSDFIPNSSCIVGWSLGGLFAINIAYLYPHKVDKLILITSQPKFLEDHLWSGMDLQMLSDFIIKADENFVRTQKQFTQLVNYPNHHHAHKNHLSENQVTINKSNAIKLLKLMLKTDLRNEYQSLNKRILHIIASKDAVLHQNASHIECLNINTETTIIDEGGHAGFLTHGTIYQNIIKDFINDR